MILSMAPSYSDNKPSHNQLANALRFLALDAVEKAQSGHPGMPMGMADIAVVLFQKFMKFNPQDPEWPDRDRFILSNGHGSMLLYALNYLTGYKGMTLEQIKNFRQLGSHAAGHPEVDRQLGIETTTGPLGQGLANSVGMALAERRLNAQFGDELVDHYTYVFAGDGCLMEGLSHEAISLAGHLKLSKLMVFFDNNAITIDGATDLSVSDDQKRRFEASHWFVQEIDGHDAAAIENAILKARASDKPSLISCKTIIGFGAPTKAGTASTHGSPLGPEETKATRLALNWSAPPFDIPDSLLSQWREIGLKGKIEYEAWENRLQNHAQSAEFIQQQAGEFSSEAYNKTQALKEKFITEKPFAATRKLSEDVLNVLADAMPNLVGGSADLTGSNNTKAKSMEPLSAQNYGGNYIYYGVREHAMAAAMNGIALHKGLIPYGGTFLVFTDYCRPAIRLSALMEQRVIYVMTHDSIGLGEDGPTHQPIEHLASLRAIPHLLVFRPADGIETAECWQLALEHKKNPSIIALTRQNLPTLRRDTELKSSRGAYLLQGDLKSEVCLIATGSEVSLAVEVYELLKEEGISAKVISAPCLELFDRQTTSYAKELLAASRLRVAIEAASPQSWHKYLTEGDLIIGMTTFGASAPCKDLYQHFNFTAERISRKILSHMEENF